MPDSRVLSFTRRRPRTTLTPADNLRRLVARMNDNVQIMILDHDHSHTALKALARFAELAAMPARRRMARAEAQATTAPKTGAHGHL